MMGRQTAASGRAYGIDGARRGQNSGSLPGLLLRAIWRGKILLVIVRMTVHKSALSRGVSCWASDNSFSHNGGIELRQLILCESAFLRFLQELHFNRQYSSVAYATLFCPQEVFSPTDFSRRS
jgi:hypothetical protein